MNELLKKILDPWIYSVCFSIPWVIILFYKEKPLVSEDVQNIITFASIIFGFYIASMPLIFKSKYIDHVSKDYEEKKKIIIAIGKAYRKTFKLMIALIISLFFYQYCLHIFRYRDLMLQLWFSAGLIFLTVACILQFWRLFNNCLVIFAKNEMV